MTKPDVLKYRSCVYRDYYVNQAGDGLSKVYVGTNYQRGHGMEGHGIGSFFAGLFRKAKPFLMRGAKFLGGQALSAGTQILSDVQKGDNIKEAAKRRINETYDNLKQQYGSGKRTKRVPKKRKTAKAKKSLRARKATRKVLDIFTSRKRKRHGLLSSS